MDIRTYMPAWLSKAELERRGGRYVGTISDVVEMELRNRFTATRERRPVIEFADGARLVPGVTMMRALATMFGHETGAWHGRRLVLYLRRVEQVDKTTGQVRVRHERAVMAEADTGRRPETERADYDDSDEALAEAGVAGGELCADDIFGGERRRGRG